MWVGLINEVSKICVNDENKNCLKWIDGTDLVTDKNLSQVRLQFIAMMAEMMM